MGELDKEILVNQLLSMRASIDAALFILGAEEEVEISDSSLTGLDDREDVQQRCNHPADKREIYTVMGGKEHWKCKICGFEYKSEEEG